MFVDELTITAKAGNGGDGVVRWRQEKFKPHGGPSGGNGGDGGDVYMEAISDINRLSKYVGTPSFTAPKGEEGRGMSQHGSNGEDYTIFVPVGSIVKDIDRERVYTFDTVGQRERVLKGGRGGLGNEYFKSSTNRSPQQATKGKKGESGTFYIEVALMVDVGLIGLPNVGKSTLLNQLTNAASKVGSYPFTTLSAHLGMYYSYSIADIPGLIEGASAGKGLGHTFLRHVTRTKMLLHLVSLEFDDPENDYYTIRNELENFNKDLLEKEEWIILTKKDVANKDKIDSTKNIFDKITNRVFVISENDADSIKNLGDALTKHLS